MNNLSINPLDLSDSVYAEANLKVGDEAFIQDAVQNSMVWEPQPYQQKVKFAGFRGKAMVFDTVEGYDNFYAGESEQGRDVIIMLGERAVINGSL